MPKWALFDITGGVRLSSSDRRGSFEQFHSIHTGGKSEAQLTKKQAVLLMHDIYKHVLSLNKSLFIYSTQ